MNFVLASNKAKANPDDQLVPLINIVFLLLIFFLVAGQISNLNSEHIDVPLSQKQTPKTAPPSSETVLAVQKNAQLLLNGQSVDLDSLAQNIDQLRDGQGQIKLKVLADKELSAEAFMPVINHLRELKLDSISLLSLSAP